MDIDVFPNSLEYWGPTGMVFFRNVQVRWMPIQGDTSSLTLALERPGASGDQGVYADRIELQNIKARFPLPDFSRRVPHGRQVGLRARSPASCARSSGTTSSTTSSICPGSATGWGINLSSNLKVSENDTSSGCSSSIGEGIQNYMNDSPVDIGIENNSGNTRHADRRQAHPDRRHRRVPRPHLEREVRRTAVGYSRQDNDNTDGQAPTPSRPANTRSATSSITPVAERRWSAASSSGAAARTSRRVPRATAFKVQFSFKYNFS